MVKIQNHPEANPEEMRRSSLQDLRYELGTEEAGHILGIDNGRWGNSHVHNINRDISRHPIDENPIFRKSIVDWR